MNRREREQIDAFYRAALKNGGADAGPPGIRAHYGPSDYAACVRDSDGNKLQVVWHTAES